LIIVPPLRFGNEVPRNRRSYAPVELLDIMPTLYQMAKLSVDMSQFRPLQGTSLVPILHDPENAIVKQAATSQYPRRKGSRKYMGRSVRTTRYRYTYWGPFEELYDYLNDPFEATSLQGSNKGLKSQMRNQAFYGGNVDLGKGRIPFDFGDRDAMRNMPPQAYA
jgi:arylsulfatase A-like enzyme